MADNARARQMAQALASLRGSDRRWMRLMIESMMIGAEIAAELAENKEG